MTNGRSNAATIAGLLFIGLAVVCNKWSIQAVLSPDGQITAQHLIYAIAIVQAGSLLLGCLLLVKRPQLRFPLPSRNQVTIRSFVRLINYGFYLLLVIVVSDIVIIHHLFGYGYRAGPLEPSISPYAGAGHTPNTRSDDTLVGEIKFHNKHGCLGPSYTNSNSSQLRVAFFGGSTGYHGHPPIPEILAQDMARLLDTNVFVANFSACGSNHCQHLHRLVEVMAEYSPDVVVYYGGFNETWLNGSYDPRPGYPHEHYYHVEVGAFTKLLLTYSGVIGAIDRKFHIVSGLHRLRLDHVPWSDEWNRRIVDKYFDTLEVSNNVTRTIESKRYGNAEFFSFYQPYQVNWSGGKSVQVHEEIKRRLHQHEYIFDVSSEYDTLGTDIYRDICHVNQRAKEQMSMRIATIVAKAVQELGE